MKRMKIFDRILSFVLTVVIVCGEFGGLTISTNATEHETRKIQEKNNFYVEEVLYITDVEFPENETLFNGFTEELFYETENRDMFSIGEHSAGSNLSGDEKLAYDALIPVVKSIAAGDRSSAVISLGESITYEGVDYKVDSKIAFQESASEFDLNALTEALLLDCPYEMYWYDKTTGCQLQKWSNSDGNLVQIILTFCVSLNYQNGNKVTVDNSYAISAKVAAEYAKSIVNDNADKTDYDKLVAYKDAICNLVTYDSKAAETGNFSIDNDPWQLIHVFDKDNTTNVVCEGYAKAFQYLCDITSFDSDVSCYSVTGVMASTSGSGDHMWNIVTFEGNNYLVDITNCDMDTIGYPDELFLSGTEKGNTTNGYNFELEAGNVVFAYDQEMISFWDEEVLTLSVSDYVFNENLIDPDVQIIAPSMELYRDDNGKVAGVKITNNMTTESTTIWYGYLWDDDEDGDGETSHLLYDETFSSGESKIVLFRDMLVPDLEYIGEDFRFECYVGKGDGTLDAVSEHVILDYEITMEEKNYTGEDILVEVEKDENDIENYWIDEKILPSNLRILYMTNSEEYVAEGAGETYNFCPPWWVEGETRWGTNASSSEEQISVEKLMFGEVIPGETGMKFVWSEVPKSKIEVKKESDDAEKTIPIIRFESDTEIVSYTGEEAIITAPVITVNGEDIKNAQITYSYRNIGNEDVYIEGLPTEVGTYEILATLTEGDNYTSATSNTLTLIIEKQTIVAPSMELYKDDNGDVAGVKITNNMPGDEVKIAYGYYCMVGGVEETHMTSETFGPGEIKNISFWDLSMPDLEEMGNTFLLKCYSYIDEKDSDIIKDISESVTLDYEITMESQEYTGGNIPVIVETETYENETYWIEETNLPKGLRLMYLTNSKENIVSGSEETYYFAPPWPVKERTCWGASYVDANISFEKLTLGVIVPSENSMKFVWMDVPKDKIELKDGSGAPITKDDSLKNNWGIIEGNKYRFNKEGLAITGFFQVERYYYYAETSKTATENSPIGSVVKGVKNIDGKIYGFHEEEYYRLSGWQTIGGEKYYFKKDCSAVVGWYQEAGNRYYADENGCMLKGQHTIDGITYKFDEECRLITGWQTEGNRTYYLDDKGIPVIGMFQVENQWYYGKKDEEGAIVKGLYQIGEKTYLFDPKTGCRQSGFQTVDGRTFYFDKDGTALIGWIEVNGKKYYAESENNGIAFSGSLVSGVKQIDKGIYLFDKTDYHMLTGWQTVAGKKYLCDSEGVAINGWYQEKSKWYYAGTDGHMLSGLQIIDGKTYYFDENCQLYTGWMKIDGKTYYAENIVGKPELCYVSEYETDEDGWLLFTDGRKAYVTQEGGSYTGWQTIGENRYYFDKNGFVKTGLFQIGRYYYYAETKETATDVSPIGSIVKGAKIIDGRVYGFHEEEFYRLSGWQVLGEEKYYFKTDCSAVIGWYQEGKNIYYADTMGRMAKGEYEIDGREYIFDEECRLITGWNTKGENLYYLDDKGRPLTGMFQVGNDWYYGEVNPEGVIAKGVRQIGEKTYLFDSETGKRLTGWQMADGKRYYLQADGSAVNGWYQEKNEWYYAGAEGNMLSGLQEIDGNLYYFNEECQLHTGWKEIDGKIYFFENVFGKPVLCHAKDYEIDENGWLIFENGQKSYISEDGDFFVGWQTIGENRYYFDSNGFVKTGLFQIGRYYYYAENEKTATEDSPIGSVVHGVKVIDEKIYGFHDENYYRLSGWQTLGENRFFFQNDCSAVTGWYQEGDYWYYADENGCMLKGEYEIDGKPYSFDEEYHLITGWQDKGEYTCYLDGQGNVMTGMFQVGNDWYYGTENPEGAIAKGLYQIDGKTYLFDSETGIRKSGWFVLNDLKCYFNAEGVLQTGWFKVEKEWYYADENGGVIKGFVTLPYGDETKEYYFDENYRLQTGWIELSGIMHHFNSSEKPEECYSVYTVESAKGWITFEGKKSYFNSLGKPLIGWQTISKNKYYFDENGVMQTGWFKVGNYWHYAKSNGIPVTGLVKLSYGSTTKQYYFDGNYRLVTGWKKISNKYYFFNTASTPEKCYAIYQGNLKKGWMSLSGGLRCYVDSNGKVLTGWQTISGKRYYFNGKGVLQTGWFTVNGKTYYGEKTGTVGAVAKGLKVVDGETYIFHSKNYYRLSGWQTVSGKRYYLGSNGTALSGWQTIDGRIYYGEEKAQKGIYKGTIASGIKEINGNTYVFDSKNFYKLTGVQSVNGAKFYLNEDGAAQTGWFTVGTDLYYGEPSTNGKVMRGTLATGAKKIDGEIYFFDTAKNYRVTGLQTSGGKSYYLNEEGVVQTGWIELNGGLCYGDLSSGVLAVGAKEIDGKTYVFHGTNFTKLSGMQTVNGNRYYLDSNGIAQTGWITVSGKTYYGEPTTSSKILKGTFAKGFKTIGGKKYYFHSTNYNRLTGWQTISKKKYYFDANGVMQTGWYKVGSYWYYAKSSGNPVSGLVKLTYNNTTKQYYFDGNYRLMTGWKKISNKYYFFNTSSSPEKCYATYTGSLKKGWMSLSGGLRCYVDSKGKLLTGWHTISGKRYYFNGKGVVQTGWFTVNGKSYYGEPKAASGAKQTIPIGSVAKGLKVINGETYIFHSKDYYRLTGWQTLNGKRYYLGSNGSAVSGWQTIDGKLYYGEEKAQKSIYKGTIVSGAKNIDGETYVFSTKDYTMQTGYQTVGGKSYYLDADGVAQTGWFTVGTDLYYGEPETNGSVLKGTLASGAREIDGETYFFDLVEHYRVSGVQVVSGKQYYLEADGTAATGWITLEDKLYYAEPETNGSVLKGTFAGGAKMIDEETYVFHTTDFYQLTGFQTVNSKRYLLDDTGIAKTGWLEVKGVWYYAEPEVTQSGVLKGTFATGLKAIEGKTYYFDSNSKASKGWKKVGSTGYFFNVANDARECYSLYKGNVKSGWKTLENGQKIYLDSKGNVVKSLQTISKKQYYFNSYGIMQTGWHTVSGKKYFFNYDGVYLPMSKPVISAITSTVYGTADVKWNTISGVKDYTIEYSENKSFPKSATGTIEIKDTSKNSWRVESLKAGKTYYFRLKYTAWGSVNKDSDVAYSKYSDVKSIKIKSEVTPTATSATIKTCNIVDGSKSDKIVVHFEATLKERLKSADNKYYVVQTESYGTSIDLSKPCASVDKTFNVSVDFEIGTRINEALMNRFALAVKNSDGKYQVVSTPKGITNPEFVAENTTAIFKASSKKGLQGVAYASNGSMPVDARYANTKQTLLNLDIADVVNPKSSYTNFTYKGKTYKFSKCKDLVANIKSMNAGYEQYLYGNNGNTKVAVSLCLLLSYDSANSFLIDPAARSSGHRYYTLNVREEKGRETLEALFVYLSELFGQEDCYVTNWILGNEINSSKAWNYQGSLSFDNYMTCYATAFQMLYNAVKSEKTGNTISISLDNGWTAAPDTYAGKTVLDSFAKKINALNPNIKWSISYHPYSYPLTRADFWNDSSNTTNSTSTKYISMKNITVLTNYAASLEKTYKMPTGSIRILLTEQGYSHSAGAEKQAQAIARGYYIAEFNNRIDAFIIRAIVDDAEEAKGNLYFGLMNSQQDKRIAFYVYEFMDSDLNKLKNTAASNVVTSVNYSKFNSAKNILCNTNWKSYVPGFDATKLAGIK